MPHNLKSLVPFSIKHKTSAQVKACCTPSAWLPNCGSYSVCSVIINKVLAPKINRWNVAQAQNWKSKSRYSNNTVIDSIISIYAPRKVIKDQDTLMEQSHTLTEQSHIRTWMSQILQ